MAKLLITADIHGSLHAWLTIKALLEDGDTLIVAGDLFDTVYGSHSSPDFAPDTIRTDLNSFSYPLYYVYGNCDSERYYPGHHDTLTFKTFNKKIYLHHGHRPYDTKAVADIVIQGHTHLCSLEKKDHMVFMNPGSVPRPRNGLSTYGIIDKNEAKLIELKTGRTLSRISLSSS